MTHQFAEIFPRARLLAFPIKFVNLCTTTPTVLRKLHRVPPPLSRVTNTPRDFIIKFPGVPSKGQWLCIIQIVVQIAWVCNWRKRGKNRRKLFFVNLTFGADLSCSRIGSNPASCTNDPSCQFITKLGSCLMGSYSPYYDTFDGLCRSKTFTCSSTNTLACGNSGYVFDASCLVNYTLPLESDASCPQCAQSTWKKKKLVEKKNLFKI